MIREYEQSDREAVLNLLQLNTPKYFNSDEKEDLEYYLDEELEDYYVYVISGNIVGAGGINYFPFKNEARISWDFIHPDYQHKQIGSRLVQFRIARIRDKEIGKVVVRTSQLVSPFYQKHGFEVRNTTKDYWGPGLDLHEMFQELDLH